MDYNSIEFFDSGDNFNNFFYLLKKYNTEKPNVLDGKGFTDVIKKEVDKKEIIIFKVDDNIIEESMKDNKKLFFPFKKIFIDYKFSISHHDIKNNEDIDILIDGIFLNEYDDKTIVATCMSQIINKGSRDLKVIPSNMLFKKNYVGVLEEGLKEENYHQQTKDKLEIGKIIQSKIVIIIKALLNKIEKKQYIHYEKWTPCGRIKKEIIHSREVSSHKRHLWKDSGKFKIPLLSKEEILSRGYFIDEIVFRDKELRRDVPYLVLNQYTAGIKKEKEKENRVINLMKKKIYRNELLLGKILGEIFPEELIRHNKAFDKNSRLRLDYNIWDRRIGFEYDGEQHFDKELYQKLYGEGFDEQVKRDNFKDKLCKKKNIKLIRIKYNEPLNRTYIKKRLKESGVIV